MHCIFTGDLSITGSFKKRFDEGEELFDKELIDLFSSQDFVICNFEGAATNHQSVLRPQVDVRSPKNSIPYLSKRNFNVFNLANNHVFDCGTEGFSDTRNAIIENGGKYFGAGENIGEASKIVFLKNKGITLALIGICHREGLIAEEYGAGIFCDEKSDLIREKIKEAKKKADWVILNYHGGEEFTTVPMPRRRKLLHKIADFGANIIIAHHAHVFQGVEEYGNTTIFYGLGNFVFDIKAHQNKEFVKESALLKITFTKESFKFGFFPIFISGPERVKAGSNGFIDHIGRISDFGNYRRNWLLDAQRVYKQSVNVPGSQSRKRGIKLLLEPLKFVYRGWHHMKRRNFRPIYVGFIIYTCYKILGLINERDKAV